MTIYGGQFWDELLFWIKHEMRNNKNVKNVYLFSEEGRGINQSQQNSSYIKLCNYVVKFLIAYNSRDKESIMSHCKWFIDKTISTHAISFVIRKLFVNTTITEEI